MRKAIPDIGSVAAQPALIVTHGSTKKKCRPLNKDLVVIGGGPGCDIGILSPEVAHVHCILVRLPSGWIIRDCSGRATRVNGRTITQEILRDGDSIQVGTFSFEAHLPGIVSAPAVVAQSAASARIARMERSRRRLAEKALRLRGKVREHEAQGRERNRQEAELDRLEQKLRAASQESRARQAELDAYSRHLRREADRCHDLERETEAELVRQRVDLLAERQQAQRMHAEMRARNAATEATAAKLADALQAEREALELERKEMERERDQLAREREFIDKQRQELMLLRGAAVESTRDTILDETSDRLAAARRLLRELAERHKKQEMT